MKAWKEALAKKVKVLSYFPIDLIYIKISSENFAGSEWRRRGYPILTI